LPTQLTTADTAGSTTVPLPCDCYVHAYGSILFHGYGADERDLAPLGPRLAPGLPWTALRGPVRVAAADGHAWFPLIALGDRDPGRATDAVWRWIDAHLSPDAKVVAVGFSQGGLMATQLLRTRPERVAATVVLSGFVQAAPQPADERLAAERPAVFWGRGTTDRMITADAIERTGKWLPAHSTLTRRVYPGLAHCTSEVGGVHEAMGETADGKRPGLLLRPSVSADWEYALRTWLTDDAFRTRLRRGAHERRPTLRTRLKPQRQPGRRRASDGESELPSRDLGSAGPQRVLPQFREHGRHAVLGGVFAEREDGGQDAAGDARGRRHRGVGTGPCLQRFGEDDGDLDAGVAAHPFDGSFAFVVGLVVVDAELCGDQGLQNQVAVLRQQDAQRLLPGPGGGQRLHGLGVPVPDGFHEGQAAQDHVRGYHGATSRVAPATRRTRT
jgi:phospholipase/carboxylesterase